MVDSEPVKSTLLRCNLNVLHGKKYVVGSGLEQSAFWCISVGVEVGVRAVVTVGDRAVIRVRVRDTDKGKG
jgi:hypothetical protein